MMARQVARQFCWLGEVHSLVYGRRASGENGRKLTASTRVGSESRLMGYLGFKPHMHRLVAMASSLSPQAYFNSSHAHCQNDGRSRDSYSFYISQNPADMPLA